MWSLVAKFYFFLQHCLMQQGEVGGWVKALGWRSLRRLDWRLWGIKTNSAPTHTHIAPGQKKNIQKHVFVFVLFQDGRQSYITFPDLSPWLRQSETLQRKTQVFLCDLRLSKKYEIHANSLVRRIGNAILCRWEVIWCWFETLLFKCCKKGKFRDRSGKETKASCQIQLSRSSIFIQTGPQTVPFW